MGQQKITGIFPQIGPLGKDCNNATNAACDIPMKDDCEARYYPDRCNYPVSASQMNAIISEIANVIKDAGIDYDCSKLNNLADAIQVLIENNLYGCLPYSFPTAPTDLCSLQNLAIGTVGGCSKLYTIPSSGNLISATGISSLYPANTNIDASSLGEVYSNDDLAKDVRAGTVNWAKLNKTKIGTTTLKRECAGTVNVRVLQQVPFTGDFSRRGYFIIVINDEIKIYAFTNIIDNLNVTLTENTTYDANKDYLLPAGECKVDAYLIDATGNGLPRVHFNTSSGNTDLTTSVLLYQR